MLSAQTTDVNVNRVTERLFEKYRRPEDYLAVPPEELEQDIFATGFYRQKTKSIRGAMRVLLEEFDGEVPRAARRPVAAPRRRAEDGERRCRRAGPRAGDRRRHARPPALATARPHAERRSGEDRARPPARRAAGGLGALPAPPHLARSPDLRRAATSLRRLRAVRSLPGGAAAGSTPLSVSRDPAAPTAGRRASSFGVLGEQRVARRRDDRARGGRRLVGVARDHDAHRVAPAEPGEANLGRVVREGRSRPFGQHDDGAARRRLPPYELRRGAPVLGRLASDVHHECRERDDREGAGGRGSHPPVGDADEADPRAEGETAGADRERRARVHGQGDPGYEHGRERGEREPGDEHGSPQALTVRHAAPEEDDPQTASAATTTFHPSTVSEPHAEVAELQRPRAVLGIGPVEDRRRQEEARLHDCDRDGG